MMQCTQMAYGCLGFSSGGGALVTEICCISEIAGVLSVSVAAIMLLS